MRETIVTILNKTLKTAFVLVMLSFFASSMAQELEDIPDGAPTLNQSSDPVQVDPNASNSIFDDINETTYKETGKKGTGIDEIEVENRVIPNYILRKDRQRANEGNVGDGSNENLSIPEWKIGSW